MEEFPMEEQAMEEQVMEEQVMEEQDMAESHMEEDMAVSVTIKSVEDMVVMEAMGNILAFLTYTHKIFNTFSLIGAMAEDYTRNNLIPKFKERLIVCKSKFFQHVLL